MKKLRLLAVCSLLALSAPGLAPRTATAATNVSFDFFYETLKPYGEWVDAGEYGYCWWPSGVAADWRPYADGSWVYSDAGWTWVSYEEFGSVTYHYGRWVRLADYGWVWVPGYEWGPAWVSWRTSGEFIGWAPLPPECRFRREVGISVWVDSAFDIGPGSYNFCEVRDFGAPALRPVILPRQRNVAIIGGTLNVTNITMNNNLVFNGGPDYRIVSQQTAKPIRTLQLVQQTDPDEARAAFASHNAFARARGNSLTVFAPFITRPAQPVPPPPGVRVFKKPNADKGWGVITDPGTRQQITEKIRAQTRNMPEFVPATPVAQGQIILQPSVAAEPVPPPQKIVVPPNLLPPPDSQPAQEEQRRNSPRGVTVTRQSLPVIVNPPIFAPPPNSPNTPPSPQQQQQMQAGMARRQQMEEQQRQAAAQQAAGAQAEQARRMQMEQQRAAHEAQMRQQQILQQQQAAQQHPPVPPQPLAGRQPPPLPPPQPGQNSGIPGATPSPWPPPR